MRSTPSALLTHMALGTTTLAILVAITRADSEVLRVTGIDQDVEYPPSSGTIYKASLSVDASAMITTAALNVDNLEVRSFLTALGVTEADIAAGLYDFAEVRCYRVNYADLTMGDEKTMRGWLGEISTGAGEFRQEVRSLAQKLQSGFIELVSESCKAELFDARCKVVKTEGVNQFSGVVVSTLVAAQRQFTCAALTQDEDFFTAGTVAWTAGANAGLSKEIKKHDVGGNILLQEPMPYAIAASDELTIFAGCLKRFLEDCVGKHNNGPNHRGYPFVPGNDAALRGPQ